MKKTYEKPDISIEVFNIDNYITTSNTVVYSDCVNDVFSFDYSKDY